MLADAPPGAVMLCSGRGLLRYSRLIPWWRSLAQALWVLVIVLSLCWPPKTRSLIRI